MVLRVPYALKYSKVFILSQVKNLQKKNNENYLADYIEEHAEHCGLRIFDVEERRERARADLGIFFLLKIKF